MQGAWPLVGREEELRYIEDVAARPSVGVVLAGPAGCGKTRLAAEVIARAAGRGLATEWIVATASMSTIPFGAFAQYLEASDVPLQQLIDLRRALRDRSAGRRLVLGVDDAHLLDERSAAFVRQLAGDPHIFLVVTVRTGERTPEPIVALWKEAAAERLELQDLSWVEVGELLTAVLHGPLDQDTLHDLWLTTGGNVLYVREIVLGGLASGALRRSGTTWTWHGPLLGPRLADLLESRLGHVPPGARDALELLGIAEPLDATVLARMTSDDVLADVEERGLVGTTPDGARVVVRLAHPLYAETLRQRIPSLRLRALQRRLVDELTTSNGRSDRQRVAAWRLELGDDVDVDSLLDGSWFASSADPALGERLARAAIDAGGGFEAQRAHANSLNACARYADAEEVFGRLATVAPTDELRVLVAFSRASNAFWGLRRPASEAIAFLDAADDVVTDDSLRRELAAVRSMILLFAGRTSDAGAEAQRVVKAPDDSPRGQQAALRALSTTALIAALQADHQTVVDVVDRAMPLAMTWLDANARALGWLFSARFLSAWLGGSLDDAEAIARMAMDLGDTSKVPEIRSAGALALGRVELARGRVRSAAARLDEAVAQLRRFDPAGFLPFACSGLVQALALGGSIDLAQRALQTADDAQHGDLALFDVDLLLARAWLSSASGAEGDAARYALDAADRARELAQPAFEAHALMDAVRLGTDPAACTRLCALASTDDAFASAARATGRALSVADAAAIAAATDRFEGLGFALVAADVAALAGEAYASDGSLHRSRTILGRSSELARRCEGASTPITERSALGPLLTPREREIARLAASGLTNRAIAEALVLSVRTVDNHLHQAYAKLGVRGRRELRTLIGADGP